MQGDGMRQQENRQVSTYTLTRSLTHSHDEKTTGTVQKEGAALPFLPLVLHPALSSFPS